MDCGPPGSSFHGILQARILDSFPFPYPGDLPNPGIELRSPALQADSSPYKPPGKPLNMCSVLYAMYSQYGCKKLGPIGRISKELNSAQHKNGHFSLSFSLCWDVLPEGTCLGWPCTLFEGGHAGLECSHQFTQSSGTNAYLCSFIYCCSSLNSLCSNHPGLPSSPQICHILSLPWDLIRPCCLEGLCFLHVAD